jgi:hypothetical protein
MSESDMRAIFVRELIKTLEVFGPDVTSQVVAKVEAVPDFKDPNAYVEVAVLVGRLAAEEAMKPIFAALEAEGAAHLAREADAKATYERFLKEFEVFRRMKVSRTIQ